ncbi:transposase (plasmid) [Deinococcus aetherius]|uniref:Transposase n=1 Tax=Deinococcus aetherius TaxID=200252 RepID=A0ABM8ALM9_9DEIO|nr:ISL3 family transposase [Deinococcus aetherius]BDP44720.1 transposase [Deinococcus aetherius]
MDLQSCLPDPELLTLSATTVQPEVLWLDLESRAPSGVCPSCGQASSHRHSRYTRILKDVALLGRRVRLRLTVRKFFCDTVGCAQRIFCERLPSVAYPWRRKTVRLERQNHLVALEVGAESAARVLGLCGCPVSADTLLAGVRRPSLVQGVVSVRHLGIDDWAWCKGKTYGTILVDLERHCVVDLLPDREADTLAGWLTSHPEIEVITRDRGGAYQEGALRGAPQAQQVADRWHLLKNLRETLERYFQRTHSTFTALRKTLAAPDPPPLRVVEDERADEPTAQLQAHPPSAHKRQCFEAVKRLLAEGSSVKQTARETGVAIGTVRKYAQFEQHPGTAARPPRHHVVAPYREWLTAQWAAGRCNAVALHQELRERGYPGGYTAVREFCRHLRTSGSAGHRRAVCPSPRTLSWAVLVPSTIRAPEVGALLEAGRATTPEFVQVERLLTMGWTLLRGHEAQPLRGWLSDLEQSDIRELRAFAVGLDRDFDAVRAALETTYSNGQVEGQVNRLKTIKRGMYGRAGLDLLKARVLHQAQRPAARVTKS